MGVDMGGPQLYFQASSARGSHFFCRLGLSTTASEDGRPLSISYSALLRAGERQQKDAEPRARAMHETTRLPE